VQKHNEHVFVNKLHPKFIFKTMDINHQSCPPSYKLSNDLSKIIGLHFTIQIKNVGNYAMYDGLVNEVDDIFKASTTYCDKTIIWVMFQILKIGILIRENTIIIITTLN